MKKNKFKVLLSIIVCLCMINIGGMFSYAGGSSGGSSGGGFIYAGNFPFIVAKAWAPNSSGNYGPNVGQPVNINVDLSFQVPIAGQDEPLNFRMSRSATTQPKPQYPGPMPMMPNAGEDKSKNSQVAYISFATGVCIEKLGFSSYLGKDVTTMQDANGGKYTCQFRTDDLLLNPETGEARIKELIVYETPSGPIEPPSEIPKSLIDNLPKPIEQPRAVSIKYQNVKAMLTIKEEEINDYDSNITIAKGEGPQPFLPPGGGGVRVESSPQVVPDVDVELPTPVPDDGQPNDGYFSLNMINATVTNTYNPPTPEDDKPPAPPEEKKPPIKDKPETGDTTNLVLFISLLGMAIGTTVVAVRKKNS